MGHKKWFSTLPAARKTVAPANRTDLNVNVVSIIKFIH